MSVLEHKDRSLAPSFARSSSPTYMHGATRSVLYCLFSGVCFSCDIGDLRSRLDSGEIGWHLRRKHGRTLLYNIKLAKFDIN